MPLIKGYVDKILELAFDEDASYEELFIVACAWAVIWAILFPIIEHLILYPFAYGKPWLRIMTSRDLERMGGLEGVNETYKTDFKTKEEAIDEMMKQWVTDKLVMFQHLMSGILCIPSLLGRGDPSLAASLAANGLLCEMGYELFDFVKIFYTRLRYGKEKMPNVMIFGLTAHHSLACSLSIPMILRYRDWKVIHWICFNMAGMPGVTMPMVEYAKTLDITKPNDLAKFKVVNFVLFLLFLWTRGLHWVYLVAKVFFQLYQEKAWKVMMMAVPPLLAITLVVNLAIVVSVYKRFMKFRKATAEYESLPEDAPKAKKLASQANFEQLAQELLDETENIDPVVGIIAALDFLEDRKVERRQTMPPTRMNKGLSMKSMRMIRGATLPPRAWKKMD